MELMLVVDGRGVVGITRKGLRSEFEQTTRRHYWDNANLKRMAADNQ